MAKIMFMENRGVTIMEILRELFFGHGVAHTILILSLVIAVGFAFGKLKFAGVSLGITCILFAGIVFSHFKMTLAVETLHFLREFGLILFIYAVGMQVGPHFFASFKRGGLKLNLLAVGFVFSGIIITIILYYVTKAPISAMVGVMSGAVTNTPGLGAAQQAFYDITGTSASDMSLSYAVAYIVGVLGMISGFIILRKFFRINVEEENKALRSNFLEAAAIKQLTFMAELPHLHGLTVGELQNAAGHRFKVAGLYRKNGELVFAARNSKVVEGDKLLVEALNKNIPAIKNFIQTRLSADASTWALYDNHFASQALVVSNFKLNGKKLIDIKPERRFNVNITHIKRDDVDLVTSDNFILRAGDVLMVKGTPEAIKQTAELVGNDYAHLNEPNLIHVFLGITIGVLVGSLPFLVPGVPQPVKLGLAGGPLIIAILVGCFGTRFKLVTYATKSANLMLREVGIAIFLACIGLNSGAAFVQTVVYDGGYIWLLYAVFITIIPVLLIGFIARKGLKLNYFTLMGVIAGSSTNPTALAYANSGIKNRAPAMGYATVYPLAMFLRVFGAQLLIIFFVV